MFLFSYLNVNKDPFLVKDLAKKFSKGSERFKDNELIIIEGETRNIPELLEELKDI